MASEKVEYKKALKRYLKYGYRAEPSAPKPPSRRDLIRAGLRKRKHNA